MSKVVQVVVLETDVVFLPVSWGYPILAGNGREARDRLEELRPVLVVSDIMMPIMDGWTLCRLLRAEAQYQALPIVLMSAAMPPDSNTDYTAFIRKPFQIHDLVSTLTAILGPPDASESS